MTIFDSTTMIIAMGVALLFLWPVYVLTEVDYDYVPPKEAPREFGEDFLDWEDEPECGLLCNVGTFVSRMGKQFLKI